MMFTLALTFLNGSTITLRKIPDYSDFEGQFPERIDKKLCSLILQNDEDLRVYKDSDGKDKMLTDLMISTLRSHVFDNIDKHGNLRVIHSQSLGLGRFKSRRDYTVWRNAYLW